MNIETGNAINNVKLGNQNYYLKAYAFAKKWVKETMLPFSSEDLKSAYYAAGNQPPDEPRVFGAVIKELQKDGLIHHYGFQAYKAKEGHCRPSNVWISKAYINNLEVSTQSA